MEATSVAHVDGARDHDHGLAFGLEARGIGSQGFSRIREAILNVAVMIELLDVGCGRDYGGDDGAPFGSLAQFEIFDSVAGGREGFEVADDFVPVEEFIIDTHLVAEMAFRGGNRGCGLEG